MSTVTGMETNGVAGSETKATGREAQTRYDRQLRLWGEEGQAALSGASVCCVGATGANCEALKSLVLPGLGSFTIIDHRSVTEANLGENFFLEKEDVGRPLAEATAQRLLELNPAVKGSAEVMELEEGSELSFLEGHSLVIISAGFLPDSVLQAIDSLLHPANIPLIILRAFGFLGYLRVSVAEHWAVQTHVENRQPDLRLPNPFPALRSHLDTIQLHNLTHQQHSHIPYVILLFKALERWREEKGKGPEEFPASYAERKEVKACLEAMRMPDEKGRLDEENFAEALGAANRSLVVQGLSSSLTNLLSLAPERLRSCTHQNRGFWALMAGLRRFLDERGCLPVSGTLPDMTADSKAYLSLLELYHAKAKADAEALKSLALEEAELAGVGSLHFDDAFVAAFARNAAYVEVWSSGGLSSELSEAGPLIRAISSNASAAAWLLALKAAQRFKAEKARYPGTNGIPVELDELDLEQRVKALATPLGLEEQVAAVVTSDHLREVCRFGGGEIHVVAAWIGGAAAQEAIKLMTHQYRPLHNTLLYDGVTQEAATFTL